MTRRPGPRRLLQAAPALLFLAVALASPGCREDRQKVTLGEKDLALLHEKADEKIGLIIKENLPALFAGLVVFRSDAFLYNSAMLDQRNVPVLNVFGNAAIVLLNSPDIPLLLTEPAVRKIRYLCRQRALVRLDPAFEMELIRRYADGREDENVSIRVRFRDPPKVKDEQVVTAAGFRIDGRAGYVWTVSGPLASLPRLLEHDAIVQYEQ